MDWTPKYFGPEGLERGLLETISWFKGHDGSKSQWKKYQV
jgi:hypothetical protein